MKDNAGFAVILIASIGLNIVLGIIASDCPSIEQRQQEAQNAKSELQILQRRLDQSKQALQEAGITVNEFFYEKR